MLPEMVLLIIWSFPASVSIPPPAAKMSVEICEWRCEIVLLISVTGSLSRHFAIPAPLYVAELPRLSS